MAKPDWLSALGLLVLMYAALWLMVSFVEVMFRDASINDTPRPRRWILYEWDEEVERVFLMMARAWLIIAGRYDPDNDDLDRGE